VNGKIAQAEGGGSGTANDLRDQRDQAADRGELRLFFQPVLESDAGAGVRATFMKQNTCSA